MGVDKLSYVWVVSMVISSLGIYILVFRLLKHEVFDMDHKNQFPACAGGVIII